MFLCASVPLCVVIRAKRRSKNCLPRSISRPKLMRVGGLMHNRRTACLAASAAFLVASSRYRKQTPDLFNPYLFWGIVGGHAVNLALQAANALAIAPGTASGIFVCGLLWYLLHGAVQFSRILLVQPR